MKKLLIGLGVVIVVIVVAVIVVPPLINWKILEPRIAEAVRDATGRELRIEGDIRVSLVPLELSVSGVRLSNAKGMRSPEMVSVASVEVKLGLLPLLSRSVVVESFVVREPAIFLEVDASGRPNWVFEAAAAPAPPPEPAEAPDKEEAGLPISDLQLVDVRIEQGLFSYVDASTGQSVQVKDLSLKLALAGLGSPFTLTGRLTLNDEPVALDVSLDSPKAMLGGERAKVALVLASKHINASYDGAVQQQPIPGLDGALDLDVPSVGALAAWLGQPLDEAQPDPGPLEVHAALTADGPKVVLKEAIIKGKALDVRASGSFDGSGDIAKVVVNIESGVLDIDRYLPPPSGEAKPAAEQAERPAGPEDMLAMLPTEPFDLSPLRQTEANVNVAIGGIKAMGFEVGRIAFATTLKNGVLAAKLSELALYGGNVKGTVELDASGDALGVAVAMTIDSVNLGRLAEAAMGGEAPVAGILSSTLTASGKGASPRALVEGLSAKVAIDLGGIDVKDAPVGAISELKLALDLPGLESPPSLKGSVVYNKERVALDLTLDPLKTVLSGESFALKAAVTSKHLKASYDGAVQQQPIPGLDGALDLDVPSVGALAAWLGQPLDEAQPDPGPLEVHAALTADGPKVVLKEAIIKGKALDVRASGSFDGSGDIAKVVVNIESGVLDIDRYLPPPSGEAKPAAEQAERPAGPEDMLAMLPTEPFDLSPLRQTEANVNVAIGGIKAMGFEVGRIAFATTLKNGVLAAKLSELALYGGNVKGTVELDASGDALGVAVAMTVDSVNLGRLAEAAMGGEAPVAGILSSTLTASGKGASPRALVEGLSAKVAIDLGGIDVKDAPVGAISELKLALDLPGLESPPSLKSSVVYNKERVVLDLTLDPLKTVLSGERFALKAAVTSKHLKASYDGAVQQKPIPGLDGTFDLDVPSVGKLAAWLGQPLDEAQPDPGPLTVHATLTADGPKVVLKEAIIKGKALNVRASGSFDGSGKIALFAANVEVQQANLNAYLPPTAEEEKAPAKEEPAEQQAAAGWSEEPIDFGPLRQAEGEAKITIGTVLYKDLTIKSGRITVTLAGGVLRAAIEDLQIADGTVDSSVTLDASGSAATLDYQASIVGVEARALLKSLADNDRLSGKADFQTRGSARGRNQKQFVETLNGDGSFRFLDGAIHGINLAATLRKAKTLGFGAEGDSTQKTDFAEVSGSFVITDGILENRDFKMLAPLLRARGEGTVPLPPQTVDYRAEVKLVATTKGQGGEDALVGLPIPIHITGPWSNPSYGVDWNSVFSAAVLDPSRLANMPASLRKAAEGAGVSLPIPKLPGSEALGGILKVIPGFGGAKEESPGASEPSAGGGIVEQMQQLFKPKPQPTTAPATTAPPTTEPANEEEKPALPAPLKSLKRLFGG
jgi:AsmA protein